MIVDITNVPNVIGPCNSSSIVNVWYFNRLTNDIYTSVRIQLTSKWIPIISSLPKTNLMVLIFWKL